MVDAIMDAICGSIRRMTVASMPASFAVALRFGDKPPTTACRYGSVSISWRASHQGNAKGRIVKTVRLAVDVRMTP